MLADLLSMLTAVPVRIAGSPPLPKVIVDLEMAIAHILVTCVSTPRSAASAVRRELLASVSLDLARASYFLEKDHPYRRPIPQVKVSRGTTQRPTKTLVRAILKQYQINLAFEKYIDSTIEALDILFQALPGTVSVELPRSSWGIAKARLARRSILLGLVERWDEDHCSEPILWKCRRRVAAIARSSSDIGLSEMFSRIVVLGCRNRANQNKDSLREFLIEANDEKNKLLIDNLVLSKHTYESLVDSGWQPDRWELENLPITIELLLEYMRKAGCIQEKEIGQELVLSVTEALNNYRYSGTPFVESSDTKKVRVVAPGWQYQGELIIQPRVREIS